MRFNEEIALGGLYMTIYEKVMADKGSERSVPEKILSYPREKLYSEWHVLFDHCRELQENVLSEILQRAQGCQYAKDHHFDGITDIDTWRKICPVSIYKDYESYIDAEINGSQHQLYHANTAMAVATTGSTGKIKVFLESEAGNAAKLLVMAVRGMIMGDLLPVTRDYSAKNLTISNYSKLGTTPNGLSIVRASGQTARNLHRQAGPMNILTVPFWEIEGLDAEEREYAVAVFALSDVAFSKIFCNNLIAFGRVLDLIEARGKEMIEDIRRGTFSVNTSEETLTALNALLEADPTRADELQRIYDYSGAFFSNPDEILEVWPNLQMASCWMSGSVGRDAYDVIQRMPRSIRFFDMGFGATEGKFNIPMKLESPIGAAAIFSVFFEFVPLDGGEPCCIWEIENGKYYEMLVTTYSGLYRYNMLDVVRFDGFKGNTPKFVFCGKSTECVKREKQNIYGYEFTDVVHAIEKSKNIAFDLVQVLEEEEGVSCILSTKQSFLPDNIYSMLNEVFMQKWKLPCKRLYIVNKQYKKQLFDDRLLTGRGACGIKLPVIIKTPPSDKVIEMIIQ